MRTGAIILCGGQSTRMGSDKALLPLGSELMLQRVVRLVGEVVDASRIVVVAAEKQKMPDLPREISVTRDERPNRGPLEGMAAGLRALDGQADAAFVTSCDAPLLVPAFVERMFELLGGHEVVVPRDEDHVHPLAAVYRLSALPQVEQLLAGDRLRTLDLLDTVSTHEVNAEELREVDPQLATLKNLNTEEDYVSALASLRRNDF